MISKLFTTNRYSYISMRNTGHLNNGSLLSTYLFNAHTNRAVTTHVTRGPISSPVTSSSTSSVLASTTSRTTSSHGTRLSRLLTKPVSSSSSKIPATGPCRLVTRLKSIVRRTLTMHYATRAVSATLARVGNSVAPITSALQTRSGATTFGRRIATV